jgi:hypothetical protein
MAQPSLKPHRKLGAAIAFSLAALLAFAAAAPAAGDQVGSGSVELKLSGGFKGQLKQNGVKLRPRKFTIKGGSFDPGVGSGSLTLNGKLKLKKGGRTVALRRLSVSLGKGGTLWSAGTKLFGLRAGRVSRQGFGSKIDGVKVKLLRKGARKLNRQLGLRSLHPGNAGTLSVTEVPKTVPVKGGQTRVVPSLDPDKSIAFKLDQHCVQTIGGAVPIPPAQQDAGFAFIFPAVGGTIGPDGNAGLTLHSGGVQLNKDASRVTGLCASVPSDARAIQTDLQFDLKGNHVFAHSAIAGYPPPLGTDKGVSIAYEIDKKQMTIDANPNAGKITISGLELGLNAGSATFLNIVFPNTSGIAMRDFMPGDLFGTATMTLNTG